MEEIKKVYDELSESNKNVLNMVAKGMKIAEENSKEMKLESADSGKYEFKKV